VLLTTALKHALQPHNFGADNVCAVSLASYYHLLPGAGQLLLRKEHGQQCEGGSLEYHCQRACARERERVRAQVRFLELPVVQGGLFHGSPGWLLCKVLRVLANDPRPHHGASSTQFSYAGDDWRGRISLQRRERAWLYQSPQIDWMMAWRCAWYSDSVMIPPRLRFSSFASRSF